MGANYKAKALIGLKIDESELYTTRKVKAFDHDYPAEYTHDPKSDKSLWKDVRTPIDGYNVDEETLYGGPLVRGGESEETFVALYKTDDTYRSSLTELVDNKVDVSIDQFIWLMRDRGLWDPAKFGLWAVL